MSVGDINSKEKGSGARFNDGKPDFSLIPLDYLIPYGDNNLYQQFEELHQAIQCVATFQMKSEEDTHYLKEALTILSDDWEQCAKVFEYGKKKYASWNWAKGMNWSIPLACIGRHYLKYIRGERIDEESGHSHIGHIMCNIVMLLYYVENYPEGDDRIDINK